MKHSLMAGAAKPFALLLGLDRSAKAPRADDEDKDREDQARAESEDDEDREDQARADAEDGDEDEEDKKDSKRSKKAKAKAKKADDDEDGAEDDEEDKDREASARRAGAKAERKRWGQVLGSPAAASSAHHLATACTMLSETTLSGSAILATLDKLPAAPAAPARTGRRSLDERMASSEIPRVAAESGDVPAANSPEAIAQAVVLAGQKRRGEV